MKDGEEPASAKNTRQNDSTKKYARPRKSADIKNRTRSQRKGRLPQGMVHFGRMPVPKGNKKTQSNNVETGRNDLGKEQPAVLATFEGLGSENFSTESSDLKLA
jgi:hypothetical protein